ncbi:MAG: hypothetical protein NTV70_24680 [Acidobacteria bacterium]|nr:hypothetical protein [Acidobacteriota bacterium]
MLIMFGVLSAVLALVAMALFGSPVSLMIDATQAGTGESFNLPLIEILGSVWMLLALVLAIPLVVTGLGLRQFRPWSRDLTMVVCALMLAEFPIGTLLAVYGFWVVLSPEVEPLFSPR